MWAGLTKIKLQRTVVPAALHNSLIKWMYFIWKTGIQGNLFYVARVMWFIDFLFFFFTFV